MKSKRERMNRPDDWIVIQTKNVLVEKFRTKTAATNFVRENNEKFMPELEVMSKDVWEYEKEEMKNNVTV
jgi:hypothetical protein